MDLGLSDNKVTSFRLFQQRIITEYDKMVDEMGLTVIDGTLPVEKQQKMVRQVVKTLQGWDGLRSPFLPARPSSRKHIIAPIEVQEGD